MGVHDKYTALIELVLLTHVCDDCVCCKKNTEAMSALPSQVLRDIENHNKEFRETHETPLIITDR